MAEGGPSPAILRLSRLAPLTTPDMAALTSALSERRELRAHRELLAEGREISAPRLIVSGWAARVRLLTDGRRQIMSLSLPGDLIGMCRQPRPLAVSTVVALTDVVHCPAPAAHSLPHLADAYAVSQALDEAYLLSQITRLGRLNAEERIGDLLLELHERLTLAGLTDRGGFNLPLTQEVLADALGLTSVHVNRMIQLMRREGDIEWKARRVILRDPEMLARRIGRMPPRVTAEKGRG